MKLIYILFDLVLIFILFHSFPQNQLAVGIAYFIGNIAGYFYGLFDKEEEDILF